MPTFYRRRPRPIEIDDRWDSGFKAGFLAALLVVIVATLLCLRWIA